MSPLGALFAGIASGLAGTLALSILARIVPGMRMRENSPSEESEERPAENAQGRLARAGPAEALTEPQAPGPEGLAQQFAFKVAAGLFAADISGQARTWAMATHLVYGSAWGALLGLIQATYNLEPAWFGPAYGSIVWAVGPALLVPAMQIMPPLRAQGAKRIVLLVAAHLVWGLVVVYAFQVIRGRLG